MSNEKIYRMIWTADSPNPGFIEHNNYTEDELPVHNADEVLGPYRTFVEIIPGTDLYKLFLANHTIDKDTESHLLNVDLVATRYNWETKDLDLIYIPEPTWDDIRQARNNMLHHSDEMFNFDTPEPLKTEWVEYRQLLRDLPAREQAKGNTPSTVYWHDYVPPWPHSARIGVPDEHTVQAAWYKGDDTYPPSALPGSPESLARDDEAARRLSQASTPVIADNTSQAPVTGVDTPDQPPAPPIPSANAAGTTPNTP